MNYAQGLALSTMNEAFSDILYIKREEHDEQQDIEAYLRLEDSINELREKMKFLVALDKGNQSKWQRINTFLFPKFDTLIQSASYQHSNEGEISKETIQELNHYLTILETLRTALPYNMSMGSNFKAEFEIDTENLFQTIKLIEKFQNEQ